MEGNTSTSSSPSRGIKRKAAEMEGPRRIRALHQDVVNKIAFGVIIWTVATSQSDAKDA